MKKTEDTRANRLVARILNSDYLLTLVFLASLLESLVVPIPLELILIPIMLSQRHRLWAISSMALAGCLVGAMIGYGIGFLFFDDLGQMLLSWLGYDNGFAEFNRQFEEHGFATVLFIGISAVPFQIAMLAAGSTGYPLYLFLIAAAIARGVRYYGLALLVHWFGDYALQWYERYDRRVAWLILVIAAMLYGVYLWL
ncbi:hypothetical protein IDSA_04370 [Pseudidiomarina salinarum]|uniref:VTT domain-containing protein n=1 Tax=Pseudidiomarina salinarum TaxID=435908 RepID=A0A094J1K0_9GAMM|nr:VTT domain-containing protein [Pseudidiomarina salinarum]KFZ31919.1 hypothetical protein IDSA_04370 [Pseudidiomarina salinarum]RUO70307.1 DedA family protein [Pseudidiomarina salinarum]